VIESIASVPPAITTASFSRCRLGSIIRPGDIKIEGTRGVAPIKVSGSVAAMFSLTRRWGIRVDGTTQFIRVAGEVKTTSGDRNTLPGHLLVSPSSILQSTLPKEKEMFGEVLKVSGNSLQIVRVQASPRTEIVTGAHLDVASLKIPALSLRESSERAIRSTVLSRSIDTVRVATKTNVAAIAETVATAASTAGRAQPRSLSLDSGSTILSVKV